MIARGTARQRGGTAPWMAGAGLLGLLVVVAIILVLMTMPMGGAAAPAGGGAGGGGGGGSSYLGAVANTKQRGRQLSVEIDHYKLKQYLASWHLEHNSYPESFEEMGEANSGVWNDAWGTQFRFTIDETVTPAQMTVLSAGGDKVWGTPDDLSHTAPLAF